MARTPSPRAEAERRRSQADGGEPWLAEAEFEEPPATLIGRRAALALIGALLLLVALVAAGLFLVTRKADSPVDIPAGEVPLVRSPGPWKVPAEGPGTDGVPVEGQGQLVFPAGEGLEPEAEIDPARLPEPPVPPPSQPPEDLLREVPLGTSATPPPPVPPSAAAPKPTAALAAKPSQAEPAASEPAAAEPAESSGTIQLGAFSSEARALATWKELSARFPFLAELAPATTPIEREGRTLWRLRASGSGARKACDRLRIAGEECAPAR